MAWNQPGGGGKDPWKSKGSNNAVDDFLSRLKDQLGLGSPKNSGSSDWLKKGLILLAVLLVFNCFKLIDERERGVVLRFGKFDRIMTPGANVKLPWPVETVIVVNATKVETVEETVSVLTKDENIVDIKFNAQYVVSDPRLYLFGYRDDVVAAGGQQGSETVRNAAESAVREMVGNNTMDTVLFERDQLAVSAKEHLQESLDLYKTGLSVSQFSLPNARFPEEVKNAFDEAINARENKNSIVNEARAYASKIVPEARGTASRIKAEAEGYREASIAKATGDSARFRLLADQYRKAPEVTRKRLYLETMQEVLSKNQKMVAGGNNILYLPINGQAQPAATNPTLAPPAQAVAPAAAAAARNSTRSETRQTREGGN
jgi:membrane protease subunit HflK